MEAWFGEHWRMILASLIGGGLGALFRAVLSGTQETRSLKTIEDVSVGAVVPALIPYLTGISVFNWIDWSVIPPGLMGAFAFTTGLSATWLTTWTQWQRRINDEGEPVIKNTKAVLSLSAAKGKGENGKPEDKPAEPGG
jgi:hypothetical protein